MTGFIRPFIGVNQRASRWINNLLPESVCRDGNCYFLTRTLNEIFISGDTVYDLGGGAQPFVTVKLKQRLSLRTMGLDISAQELESAPTGSYDTTIIADLCSYEGAGDADVVICQATLEHVHDTFGAVAAIRSILKPGGKAYIFAPCRNAVFARLNLALSQRIKERILFAIYPDTEEAQGFPAKYDRCTPGEMEALFHELNLRIVQKKLFWMSSYFQFFVPLFVAWRLWQGLFYLIARENAAETFIYVVERVDAT